MANLKKVLKGLRKKASAPKPRLNTRPTVLVVSMYEASQKWFELSAMDFSEDTSQED